MTVAIIPARGGSTRVPRKNARELGGKPLVVWSIEACFEAGCFTDVVVSTDDDGIEALVVEHAAQAKQPWRVTVLRRPPELCGDGPLEPVVEDAARSVWAKRVLVKQPTSPFVTPETLRRLEAAKPPPGFAHVEAAALVEKCTRAYFAGECGPGGWSRVEVGRRPTQDIQWAAEAGGAWCGPVGRWRDCNATPVYITHPETIDIDTPEDWAEAERVARTLRRDSLPWGEVQTLVLDCDGVLTDNRVTYTARGERMLTFHRGDGMGLWEVQGAGVDVECVSGSIDEAIRQRLSGLIRDRRLRYYLGVTHKAAKLEDVGVDAYCYVGNDVNDAEAMRAALIAVAPADAHPSALAVADYVTTARGGHGAVREVCDLICEAKGKT